MVALSNAALRVLTALANNDQAVVTTVRGDTVMQESAWMNRRGDTHGTAGRFKIRITTFRSLCRTGLLTKTREWQAFGLVYAEYELTNAGRAALAAA